MIRALLAATLFAAAFGCSSPGTPAVVAPHAVDDFTNYFGSSESDLWASKPLSHWNGSSWKEIKLPVDVSQMENAAYGGKGIAWAAGHGGVFRVHADGTVDDFTSEVQLGGGSRHVFTGGGAVVVYVNDLGGPTGGKRAFLFDGAHFQPLTLPPLSQPSLTVRSPTDIYALGAFDPNFKPEFRRENGTADYHFDGTTWTQGVSNRVAGVNIAGSSPRFPAKDVWLGCGRSPTRFDGAVLRPLAVPLPANQNCWFTYGRDRPSIIYQAVASPTETPEAYSCDTNGNNCQLLDIPGEAIVSFQRLDWDGKQWVNSQLVAKIKACVGACGYGAQRRFGVVGELEDGTQIFAGIPADGEVTDEGLFFSRP